MKCKLQYCSQVILNIFLKNPLYTCTLHCQILDLSTNKTHQDTQTRTHTITALVCVYTNQIRIEAKIQCTIHKLEKKNINKSFALKSLSKANISKS